MPRLRFRRQDKEQDGVRQVLAGAASAAAADVEDPVLASPTPRDLTAAAFFDVDNTVMQGASIYYFARGLAARKFFTYRHVARFVWQQVRFRMAGESTSHMTQVQDLALAFAIGHSVTTIVDLGEEIYDETMAERIWPGTLAMARQHLDAGQRVWLVTATPVELARLVARRLGLTGALGTVSEVDAGVYTGKLVGEPLHGQAKAEAVGALAEREGLDLDRCAAYSDSINDLPMLELVGRPVCINPDNQLKRVAKQRGWETRDWRTGRKAARIGVPTLAGLALTSGAVVGSVQLVRRRQRTRLDRVVGTARGSAGQLLAGSRRRAVQAARVLA